MSDTRRAVGPLNRRWNSEVATSQELRNQSGHEVSNVGTLNGLLNPNEAEIRASALVFQVINLVHKALDTCRKLKYIVLISPRDHYSRWWQNQKLPLTVDLMMPLCALKERPHRKSKPSIRKINTLPEVALSQLQDCFSTTEWSLFESRDLEEYTETVLSYISFCVENATITKRFRVFPNQKPWMTSAVQHLVRDRNSAFRSGDRALYSLSRANLKKGIRAAKVAYKKKI
ncbi:hypothetical protein N1851_000116 [Merluccius polli]|uniref:Uncharacterized protein n=1 Tax=Merluccius polli TaxID=89951 RepID=A0AA47NE57_MERPO|nr:hypothetical protein N1851_000116 [Merluccius polli]